MRFWSILIYILTSNTVYAESSLRLGIFGTVDAVSPLVVAGREVEANPSIPIINLLGPNMAIVKGDTLAIVAHLKDGKLIAERILEIYPVIGPVSDVSGETAQIMGSAIHIPSDINIKVGQWLAVSGLWSGAKAITSNVRRFEGGIAQLAGVVEVEQNAVGGSVISTREAPSDGYGSAVWSFTGMPTATGLEVRLMSKGVFGREVDFALWQGYASGPIASQTYMIYGSGIVGAATDARMPIAGELLARCVHKGRVVEVAPKGLEAAFAALDCVRHIRVE